MTDGEHVTSYTCSRCDEDAWYIQNRVSPAAAFFDPQVTHIECANCGYTDELSKGDKS